MATDGAAAVEVLRAELARAKEQARCCNAPAEKASAELKAEQAVRHPDKELEEEQTTRRRHEAWVGEVEQELKDAIARCKSLEQKSSEQASELIKAIESLKEARVDAQGAR